MYRRITTFILPASIFFVAIAGVALLARAPFGEIYGTLLSKGADEDTAAITLYGMTKPVVEMSVAEKSESLYIILTIKDAEAKQATLTLPADWHLLESRGVHASAIATYEGLGRVTHIIPFASDGDRTIDLRFAVTEPFTAVAFVHDALSPALFTLTHISLPGKVAERNTRIVEASATIGL